MVRIADPPSINDLTTTSGVLSGEGGEGGEGVRVGRVRGRVLYKYIYMYVDHISIYRITLSPIHVIYILCVAIVTAFQYL